MLRVITKFIWMSALSSNFSSAVCQAGNQWIGQIHLAANLPSEQSERITRDFEFFRSFSFLPDQTTLATLLKLEAVSSESIQKWLEERVKYVVAESFDPEEAWITTRRRVHFQKPNLFPYIEVMPGLGPTSTQPDLTSPDLRSPVPPTAIVPDKNQIPPALSHSPKPAVALEKSPVMRMMDNLSSPLYVRVKQLKRAVFLDLNEAGRVPLLSARLGLIRVSSGHFQRYYGKKDNPVDSPAYRLYRISNFLHEARHSDGNGKSLGFNHAICPSGPYAGTHSCDRNTNGPYRIQTEFLKSALNACTQCSAGHRAILYNMIADLASRQLLKLPGNNASWWDDTPEYAHE